MFSTKRMKILLITAVTAMALGSLGASSASATIYAAKSSSPTFKLTTPGVTIKRNGGEEKTCTLPKAIEVAIDGSGNFYGSNEAFGRTQFNCTGSTILYMRFSGVARYDSVLDRYYLQIAPWGEGMQSPYGSYFQGTGNWTWVNGSGATMSTITLSEQQIGLTQSGSQKITMSGTFTAKTAAGGLVTLSH